MCSLNILLLHNILYRITTRTTKSLFLHKNITRKNINLPTFLRSKPHVGETAFTEKEKKPH